MRVPSDSQGAWGRLFLQFPLLPASFFAMIVLYQGVSHFLVSESDNVSGMGVYGLPLDAQIPFIPYTLPLYLSFFSFYLLHKPLLNSGHPGSADYWRIEKSLILMTMVSCSFFLLFPTRVELRELALSSLQNGVYPDWLVAACQGLYLVDANTNAWPSIHVSQPIFILLAVTRCRLYSPRKLTALWLYLFLVVFSVLTMKQHYVWDVLTGVLLALLVSQLCFFSRSEVPASRYVARGVTS